MVSIVVEVSNQEYASLLVELPAPRRKPVLRVYRGILAFDGEHLQEVSLMKRASGDATVTDVLLSELLSGGEVMVQIAPPDAADGRAQIIHLMERTAVLRGWGTDWERWLEVDLEDARVEEVDVPVSTRRFLHFGPGHGFMVYVDGDGLKLRLPFDEEPEAIPLMEKVESVIAVRWITEREFSSSVDELLNRYFKMAGTMGAQARTCQVDGDLSEWSRDDALSVGRVAQIQSGSESWSGVRDASLAVATRLTPLALCTAVRIRDDEILPGRDQLEFILSGSVYRFPIPESPTTSENEQYHVAFTDQVSFGTGLEICFDPTAWTANQGWVRLRVLYYDQDNGQDVTVLATAPDVPWTSMAGVKLPRRAVDGVPKR